jgi:uncharacterized membrane protein
MKCPDWLPWITALIFVASFPATARPPTTYRVTHICTSPPTDPSIACGIFDINNKGELVGSRPLLNGVPQVAFIWRQGEFIELNALLMNTDFAFALAINDHSDVVGEFEDADLRRRGYLWRRGEISLIEIAPGQFAESAFDINDRREVLLRVRGPQELLEYFVWRARDGHLTRLELLSQTENSTDPLQLNNRGAVVGNGAGSLLWEDGTLMRIELPPGALSSNTSAINDRGAIVGAADFPGRFAGYVWQDGQAVELPLLNGFANTLAFDINNRGVIVGLSLNFGQELSAATLWPRGGDAVDVNTLIAADDPLKPFVHLGSANLINDRGQIVAIGHDSRNHPLAASSYLLTPER